MNVFKFPTPFEENTLFKNLLVETITEVHQKVKQILADFHKTAVSEMHQKLVAKQQVHTIRYQHTPVDTQAEPVIKHVKIKEPEYRQRMKKHSIALRKVFNSPYLTKNFYIEDNQLNTAMDMVPILKKVF